MRRILLGLQDLPHERIEFPPVIAIRQGIDLRALDRLRHLAPQACRQCRQIPFPLHLLAHDGKDENRQRQNRHGLDASLHLSPMLIHAGPVHHGRNDEGEKGHQHIPAIELSFPCGTRSPIERGNLQHQQHDIEYGHAPVQPVPARNLPGDGDEHQQRKASYDDTHPRFPARMDQFIDDTVCRQWHQIQQHAPCIPPKTRLIQNQLADVHRADHPKREFQQKETEKVIQPFRRHRVLGVDHHDQHHENRHGNRRNKGDICRKHPLHLRDVVIQEHLAEISQYPRIQGVRLDIQFLSCRIIGKHHHVPLAAVGMLSFRPFPILINETVPCPDPEILIRRRKKQSRPLGNGVGQYRPKPDAGLISQQRRLVRVVILLPSPFGDVLLHKFLRGPFIRRPVIFPRSRQLRTLAERRRPHKNHKHGENTDNSFFHHI